MTINIKPEHEQLNLYRVLDDRVEILRVVSARRDIESLFLEKDQT